MMGLLAASFLGWLSDHLGRKRLLAFGVLATVIANLLMMNATALWVLFVARAIAGLSAGKVSISDAFVADVTDIAGRARALGMVQSGMALGFVAGPMIAAFLVGNATDQEALRLPFMVGAVAQGVALMMILVFLHEPRTGVVVGETEAKMRYSFRSTFPYVMRHPPIMVAMVLCMLGNVVVAGQLALFPLWAADNFGWTTLDNGYLFGAIGLFIAIAQAGLTGALHHRFSQAVNALIPFVLTGLGMAIILAHASGVWAVWLGSIVFAIGYGLINPTMSSICSTRTSPDRQGAVLGLSDSVKMAGTAIGPIIISFSYNGIGHDAPLVIYVLISVFACGLALWMRQHDRKLGETA
jgi:DHA1 family tetracycline resistance protein-like MFS transporter